ncbi:MAG TPA: hypothetical protein VN944_06105, partial [Nitrospiria bacterium]|nr:hypothetical protein [Nitrospiria bacterium]
AKILLRVGGVFLLLGAICFIWPRWIAVPAGLLTVWVGASLLLRSYRLRFRKSKGRSAPR